MTNVINQMCPIQIYINNNLEWNDLDDENFNARKYHLLLERTDIVKSIKFEITQFHHSICYIETES